MSTARLSCQTYLKDWPDRAAHSKPCVKARRRIPPRRVEKKMPAYQNSIARAAIYNTMIYTISEHATCFVHGNFTFVCCAKGICICGALETAIQNIATPIIFNMVATDSHEWRQNCKYTATRGSKIQQRSRVATDGNEQPRNPSEESVRAEAALN